MNTTCRFRGVVLATVLMCLAAGCKPRGPKEQGPPDGPDVRAPKPAATATPEPAKPVAVAELAPLGGSGVAGRVTFTQEVGIVRIEARITGLAPGSHGF